TFSEALKRYFFVHLLPYIFSLLHLFGFGLGWIGVAFAHVGFCYYLLDLIILFRDPQRRALHDYFSDSVVLKTGHQIPMGWPSELDKPLASVPWSKYWLGTGLVALF